MTSYRHGELWACWALFKNVECMACMARLAVLNSAQRLIDAASGSRLTATSASSSHIKSTGRHESLSRVLSESGYQAMHGTCCKDSVYRKSTTAATSGVDTRRVRLIARGAL